MRPLIFLLVSFVITLLLTKLFTSIFLFSLSGRIGMSMMLLLTAYGHFAFTKGMAAMIPPFIPFKKGLVLFTGILEIAAVAGLMVRSWVHITSWLLIALFIVLLPANIYAAMNRVNYQQDGIGTGNGPEYLWFRIPLQLFFIAWAWFFGLYLI